MLPVSNLYLSSISVFKIDGFIFNELDQKSKFDFNRNLIFTALVVDRNCCVLA